MSSIEVPPHAGSPAFLLSQLGAACASLFAELIEPLGLSPRGYGVLGLLGGEASPTQQQLADTVGLHRNLMVGVIDELEANGWVTRRRDGTDRRAFRIDLTTAGRHVLESVVEAISELDHKVTHPLTRSEVETLTGLLLRIGDGLDLARGTHPGMQA